MIFAKDIWGFIKVEYDGTGNGKGGEEFVDNSNSAMLTITSPIIVHSISDLGIGKVTEANRYLLGFIQYIVKYRSVLEYQQGTIEMKMPTPVNDGGGETREEHQTDEHAPTCDVPWYAPPLKVAPHDNGDKGHQAFKSYLGKQRIGDAPRLVVPVQHEKNRDNVLVSIDQDFHFETWLVVWDKNLSKPIHHLGKSEWRHQMKCKFEPFPQVAGVKLVSAEISNVKGHYQSNPQDVIPEKALQEPTANQQAKRGAEYKGKKRILEHDVQLN